MDERAVEELIVEASLRPNTPIEERGSEMADTQRVNGVCSHLLQPTPFPSCRGHKGVSVVD
jgi:hypothetical protein